MKKSNTTGDAPKPYRLAARLSRIFCGFAFLAAAVVVLLGTFGVIDISINIGILVAIASIAIVAIISLFHLFWGGFFFPVATIITIMNANGLVFELGGQAIGSLFIAAALLTVAFHIIFRHPRRLWKKSQHSEANFGTTLKHFEGDQNSASLECNFGTVKAYFESSHPKDNKFTLDLECNFGSMELHVPKSWKVVDHTRSAFAGTTERNHPSPQKDAPTLTLTGEVNFGGIIIIYS